MKKAAPEFPRGGFDLLLGQLRLQASVSAQHCRLIRVLATAGGACTPLHIRCADMSLRPNNDKLLRGGLTARHPREARLLCQCFGYVRCFELNLRKRRLAFARIRTSAAGVALQASVSA